jgi:hypothetical protein
VNFLSRHIEKLLLEQDCVILPAFGGFVAHENKAIIQAERRLVAPPTRSIGFNPLLQMNDGLLTQSYMTTLHIGYAQALQRLEYDIRKLKALLYDNGKAILPGVGELTCALDGTVSFRPENEHAASPDYYGLSVFEMKPLSALPLPNLPSAPVARRATLPLVLHRAAAILIGLVVFFSFAVSLDNGDGVDGDRASFDLQAWLTLQKPLIMQPIVAQQTTESQVVETPPPPAATPTPIQKYHLIVASLATVADGEAFVARLQAEGNADARLITADGKVRVCIASFAVRTDALNRLAELRSVPATANVWVLVKKLPQ